jgi:hypothetical protein
MNYKQEKKEFEKEFKVMTDSDGDWFRGQSISIYGAWHWITQVFAKRVERKVIKKFEDILENKVKVYAKINFCKECRKQPALKKNELIMYVEKDLEKELEQLKKDI